MLRRNVLIFHAGALGDFVLAWPLALGLGRALAQSRITLITHGQKGALAERLLRLESADIETGWHALHSEGAASLPERPAKLLAGAQAVYSFLSPTPAWLDNMKRLSGGAKVVALSTSPPAGYAGHATDWLLEQLREHPVERTAAQQMLRSIAERGIGPASPPPAGDLADVLIHPGSGSVDKCWPLPCFIELAKRLQQRGRSVRFLIGEVERERWKRADLADLANVAAVQQLGSYLDLLKELSAGRRLIGNDSGPAHLAAVVGKPTIALFGPASRAAQWKPLGPRVDVVEAASWEALSVDAVMERAISIVAE